MIQLVRSTAAREAKKVLMQQKKAKAAEDAIERAPFNSLREEGKRAERAGKRVEKIARQNQG
eukprot:scaffold1105_cov184-Ochromonas_danica.AAC.1